MLTTLDRRDRLDRAIEALATDSTIADVVSTLDKPIEYVRRVLEKLERCKRAHGDAQVRVGVRGPDESTGSSLPERSLTVQTGRPGRPDRIG